VLLLHCDLAFNPGGLRLPCLIAFRSSPPKFAEKLIQVNAIGDEISAISEWSHGIWKGYHARIYVRDIDSWKIRMDYAMHL
jgi:hypothetical protein